MSISNISKKFVEKKHKMNGFDIIEAGFSNIDETFNFGGRAVADSNNLYEICTLGLIRPSQTEAQINNVHIISFSRNGTIFFAINHILRVMSDRELTQEIASFSFSSLIDCCCVSTSGRFLLICTHDGSIVIKDLSALADKDNKEAVELSANFHQELNERPEEAPFYIGCFENKLDFYTVNSNGTIKRIYLEDKFKSEVVFNLQGYVNNCALLYPYLCAEGNDLMLVDLENKILQVDDPLDIKKMCTLTNDFLVLDKAGQVYVLSSLTLFAFPGDKLIKDRFEDLIVVKDIQNNAKIQVVGFTQRGTDQNSEVKLFNYPNFDVIYSIKLSTTIHLMQIESLTEEVIFFSEVHNNSSVSELRLQYVCEVDPILRIERLIRKQCFDEAEAFAKTFNLDLEIITRAKIERIISNYVLTTKDVDELLALFDCVDNHLFKLECCEHIDCETGEDTRRMLHYTSSMNFEHRNCSKEESSEILKMKQQFAQKLFRYDTFMAVYGTFDSNKWIKFSVCDLIEEVKKFLRSEASVEQSMLIYSRLDLRAIQTLSDHKIKEILLISNNLPINCTLFRNNFVPTTLKYRPDALSIFIQWLYDRIYYLENQHRFDFPGVGIQFVKDVTSLLNLDTLIQQSNMEELINKITNLFAALNDIQMLYNNFGIKISLSEYLTEPAHTIRHLILTGEMESEKLERLIREFVCPFILKNGLNRDEILLQETLNLLKYEEEFWTNLIEVLLMFIESVDKKLEAIKGVLEIANLPWSNTVKNLARLTFGFSTDNQLAEDIKDLLVNERRLIILHKYSLQGKPVIEDIKFCFKRILYLDRESAIEDIYQLCKDDEQRYIADEIILQKLIETERYLEALNVLNRGIQPNKLIDSLFRLTYTFVSHLVSHKLVDRYFKMMDLIWKRNKFDKDRAVDRYTRFIFENTRSIYKLRAEFGISATSAQLCSKTEKRKLFDVVVKQMALSITDDYTDIEPILRFSKKVASSMSVSSDDVIVKFLSICDNFQLILNIGEHLLEISTSSQHLAVFSIFVFKYTKILAENDLDETIFDFSETCSQKDEDYILGIRLAKKLAVKALIYATTDDFHAVMEVVNWADTCCFFEVSQGVSYTHSASLSVVKRVFENYVAYIETFKHPNTRYLTHFSNGRSINQDQLRSNIKELSSDINVLIRDNEHFTAYSLIKTLHQGLSDNSQTNREVSVAINDLIRRTWLPQTLEATLSSKCLDKSLFFNLMLLFDNEFETHLETYLKAYKRQPSKLACIAQVGLDLLKLHKITTGQVDLRNIINTCKWWSKCKSYKLDYDKFFKCNTGSRFVMLVSAKLIDLDNVTEYCNDFRQDPQVCYLKYLRTLLLDWKPDVELKSDIEGKKIAIVKNDEKELFNTCWSIVDRIHNKFEVVDLVQKVWNSVNFYYYEVYLTLIYLQTNLETQSTVSTVSINKSLLMFLKKYTRTSPPTRSEIEQWYGAFPKAAFIDSLSEFRLPLTATFLSDGIWNIIKPEVNLKTYKEWFELTDVLGEFLNCQDICTYAINSLLSTALFNTSQSCEWDLYAKHENLVSEVDDCAANIEDLQRATAAVYTFMCGMPQGADKVNFAKLGYKYAKMYKERHAGEDVEQVYQKVKQRYYNYSAMHVLYKYQLPEKKYQELVAQPKKLISALYEDPRILLKAVNVMVYCPDINSAVSDLTELFGLNLEKVKYDLLEGLLQSASVLDDNYVQKYQSGNFKEFDNLKRACYMCSDAILPFWQQTLLNIGIPTNSAPEIQCDMIFKGNALKCFYYISDADAVETMTNMSQADFFRLMEKVSVIGDINTLGINVSSVVQLDDCIKKTFVVLNKHNDPLAIKCMGSLCKIYNIQDMKYWNFILNAAMNFHMAKELVDYLNYLKGGLITPVIENAWRFIVNNAFSLLSIALQDTDTSNDRITNKFIKAVHLVQACPILPSLDFDTYIQNFIARGRFDFAAALLQYAPDKKDCYLKQLLSSGTLLQDLKALKTLGVMGVEKIILTLLSC